MRRPGASTALLLLALACTSAPAPPSTPPASPPATAPATLPATAPVTLPAPPPKPPTPPPTASHESLLTESENIAETFKQRVTAAAPRIPVRVPPPLNQDANTCPWRSAGPTNISGRVTSIAVDPTDG